MEITKHVRVPEAAYELLRAEAYKRRQPLTEVIAEIITSALAESLAAKV